MAKLSEQVKNLIDEHGLGEVIRMLANAVHTQSADVLALTEQSHDRIDEVIDILKQNSPSNIPPGVGYSWSGAMGKLREILTEKDAWTTKLQRELSERGRDIQTCKDTITSMENNLRKALNYEVEAANTVEAIYNAAGFLYAPTDTLESALKLIKSQREGANALVADANKRVNDMQATLDTNITVLRHHKEALDAKDAELEKLREAWNDLNREYNDLKREYNEAYCPPIPLIKETRETLKSVGFTVPEGEHLLGTVNAALKHHASRASDYKYKFDVMEKTLMAERDQAVATAMAEQQQRIVWENSSGQWRVKHDELLAGFKALESINKMQEGMINASNARINELEKGIELANTSRNLYRDASSTNYERARAAELKLLKRQQIDNPCAHCGEQIPIEHAAVYNVGKGIGLHFKCESAYNAAQAPQQHPTEGGC